MRWTVLALLPAAAMAQDERMPLSFTAGLDRHEVAPDELESAEWTEAAGLQICPSEAAEGGIAAFTEEHRGEVATVAIGETEVLTIQLAVPYEGGCIGWGVHPVVAANYIVMLTGKAPRMPLPAEATGE